MMVSRGARFGPYEVLDRLGAGGMGEVWRARDTRLGRIVALKILPPAFAADPDRISRFEREARVLAALNHPNIATIHGVEETDGTVALVMELVEGQTLAERLASGSSPRAAGDTIVIARQLAAALDFAHARGIIHRDLKPANISITPTGLVKVLDFGLAKELRAAGHPDSGAMTAAGQMPLTSMGSIVGTMAYMSPEQARGEQVDARTDLFSLGAILYEMTTGRRAFDAPVSTLIVDAILHRMPPPPRSVDRSIPEGLERVIIKLLAKDRAARYQSASEVDADLKRLELESHAGSRVAVATPARRYAMGVAAVALVAGAAAGVWLVWRSLATPPPVGAASYEQITFFADSATSPALSADGRMLAFVQGQSPFFGSGQIYVKALPNGQPVPLTRDSLSKMAPAFSPDGSRIAYTAVEPPDRWDTWTVPTLGGEPQLWMKNTAALTWTEDKRVLFSEIVQGLHMRVVTGDESRNDVRPVYTPVSPQGMAHWSHPSPDGKSVAIVEMLRGTWTPCRVVPSDGSSEGRQVGRDGQCMAAAWSPDRRWLYFSSNVGGAFHIWREPAAGGTAEQVTNGPTEEQGIAMAPDGRSFLTSIGDTQRAVWLHDERGDRAVSKEGYAFISQPPSALVQPISPDGKKLFYLIGRGESRLSAMGDRDGELWMTDLANGQSEQVAPGFKVIGYDVSRDMSQVVFSALDQNGAPRLWLSRLDRRLPPRQISAIQSDTPRFGPNGEVFCSVLEAGSGRVFVYRIPPGGEPQKALDTPIQWFMSASPDGAWLIAAKFADDGGSEAVYAFPTASGTPVAICSRCHVDWTSDQRGLVIRLRGAAQTSETRTIVLANEPGRMLPRLPQNGVRSEDDLAGLSVAATIDGFAYPIGMTKQYVDARITIQRNIYRVPIR